MIAVQRGVASAFSMVLALVAPSCTRSCTPSKARSTKRTVDSTPQPVASVKLEPLIEWKAVDSLRVDDYAPAYVSVPVGATSRRPIVLAAHGNNETPEAFCTAMRDVVGPKAFVLCPRGELPPRNQSGYIFTSPQQLALECEAGIRAIERAYPAYVDKTALMYVGFSRGAYLSVPIISTEPARFPRAILIEGGQDAWTDDRIRAFGAAGGKRIFFACGQIDCRDDARAVSTRLNEVGVETRVTYREAGHVYTGPVGEELRKGIDWVTEGDTRWQ
jgi:predicted esterase